MSGRLLLVGTPIGNLSDLSPRAVEALQAADVILCEDTRHSRKLLTHFRIERPLESYHDHNEEEKAQEVIERIESGQTFALISDAGLPVLSDPGYRIVRKARERGILVEPIPGPFAGALALISSGVAPMPFTFLGFAPHRRGERIDFYRRAATLGHTVVLYESPERIIDSLEDALEVFGPAEGALARELTKMHEEIISGALPEILETLRAREAVRGELTVVLAAPMREASTVTREQVLTEFERMRGTGLRRNDAVKAVAEHFGLRKNEVYRLLLNASSE